MNIQVEAAPLPKLPSIDQAELDTYLDTIRLNAQRIDEALKGSEYRAEWIINTTFVEAWCTIYPFSTDSAEEFETLMKPAVTMLEELKQKMNWCEPLIVWGIAKRAIEHGSKSIEPFIMDSSS